MIQQRSLDKLRTLIVSDDPRQALLGILMVCLAAGLIVGALFGSLGPVLSIGLIGVGVVGYLVLKSTKWGFLALITLIILLPYGTLPFKIGFTPTFLNVALGGLYGVWFVRLVTGQERHLVGSAVGLPIFTFLAWAVVTFIAGLGHTSLSLTILRNFAEVILAALLFLVAINQVKTMSDLNQISFVFIIAGGLVAVIGLGLYIMPEAWSIRLLSTLRIFGYPTDNILRYIEDNPENAMRAIATSIDPNALGGLLIILTVVVVAYACAQDPILPRLYLIGSAGLMFLLLYFTYSRGSLVGVVAALSLMSLLRYRKLLIYMWLVGMLILILPQTQDYVIRFVEGVQGQDLATQMRYGEYKDALILIGRYPFMGVGFMGTPDIDLYIGVSSLYLLIAEQMGLVGLGLFLVVNAVFFNLVFRVWRKLPSGHPLEAPLLGYTLAVFGAMVGGIFDHFFFNIMFTHLVSLYWLVMGLGAAAALIAQTEI